MMPRSGYHMSYFTAILCIDSLCNDISHRSEKPKKGEHKSCIEKCHGNMLSNLVRVLYNEKKKLKVHKRVAHFKRAPTYTIRMETDPIKKSPHPAKIKIPLIKPMMISRTDVEAKK
uniref:Uncharacterized protein n=1 Tax=Romanomermis culicivorax TaxID=13658 RepID=A0A915I3E7_ROMCU